jgi:dihydrofolate reductase
MARTVFFTATTLDGFIATPDDSLEWLLSRDSGTGGPADYGTFIAGVGALCMGATTYEWVHRASHDAGGDVVEPWAYTPPCWVFTHHELPVWEGADVRPTAESVTAVHPAMVAAAGGADVWVVGGGELAGQFLDAGLLDEVIVAIAPVTLGAGKPLLPRHAELRCLESALTGEFVTARYEVVRR